ncbi:MAG: hypothetical protein ACTJF6_04240 [Microbacteriaceae bacterium]
MTARMSTTRKLFIVLTMWLPAVALIVTRSLWIAELPAELPTHWGASGPADGASAAGPFFGWMLGISLAAAIVGTVMIVAPVRGKWVQRATAGVIGAVAFFPLAMWITSAAPSRGVTDPYTVELGAWFALLMLAPAYGLLPLVIYPKIDNPAIEVVADAEVEPVELEPGEVASWSRTIVSKMFVIMTILLTVLQAAIYIPVIMTEGISHLHWSVIVAVLVVLLVAAFCVYRVSVDWRGLRVTSGLFGFPIKRLSPEQIVKAEVAEINPGEWGGWGYRIAPGRSAIVLKQGPGFVVTQANGKLFAVTLERPEEPVSVMQGLLDASKRRGDGKGLGPNATSELGE